MQSLELDIDQASAFDRPSVFSPAAVIQEVEVSEIKIPLQYTARAKQQAKAVPLVSRLPNEVCKQLQYPQ